MKNRKKTEKFWDKIAKHYDRIESKDEAINNRIIEISKKWLKTGDTVLDYGCGTGTASIDIAEKVKSINGIDISSQMIEIAKRKSAERSIENIHFTQTSIFDESLKLGSFDVILCFYLIHLLNDTEKEIQKLHSLLKPNGLMISATPCMRNTLYSFLLTPLSKIGIVPPIRIFSISELKDLITSRSFDIIETECLEKKGNQYYIVARKK